MPATWAGRPAVKARPAFVASFPGGAGRPPASRDYQFCVPDDFVSVLVNSFFVYWDITVAEKTEIDTKSHSWPELMRGAADQSPGTPGSHTGTRVSTLTAT
jgi:hypothetical protein